MSAPANAWQLFWPGVAFAAALLLALAARAALLGGLRRWRGRDDHFGRALRLPSLVWAVVLALFLALELAALPDPLGAQLNTILRLAIILSVTVTTANVLASAVVAAGERRALGVGVTGLARTTVRAATLLIGALVLLGALGIEITPLLTALGVGGLAVALALQDTLSNLFAGVHLLADRPIRVGDYVKIGDAVEGHVVDVGWRSTRVRRLQNTVVIVPNKTVAESVITNYDLPESRMALLLRVGVAYGTDPDRVEALLLDEAQRAAREVPGLLADPAPVVRFIPGFGEYSLDFTLVCQVATFVDQYLVQHELRKRILRRFAAEGIEIPFPVRTLQIRDGVAPRA
ncbi:MAG TPA: mechanosensitive ion channel family protein, partial [Candidatus Tectomicrobia bacterium]|nr:mechanosensitive ion channel family protein [Candidatus Tectomicrobia bacterium]